MVLLRLLLATVSLSSASACPPFLPTLPVSSALSSTNAIQQAVSSLKGALNDAIRNTTDLGDAGTSFSLDVYSIHDQQPLFAYDFSASGLSNTSYGVTRIDANTIYRVASVTKVLTIYTWLTAVGVRFWNDPITKFIPELAAAAHNDSDSVNLVDWDQVTISSLASQLTGIARDTATDAQSDAVYQQVAGLPSVAPVPGKFCNGLIVAQYPCTRKDAIDNLPFRHPIHAVGTTPTYSNIAFQLIAWALEEITGSDFDTLVDDTLAKVGTNSSYYPLVPQSAYASAIIPSDPVSSDFSSDLLSDNPSGAFYSTINDMRKLGIAILNSSLLPVNTTNWWLKPSAFTPDRYISVGAPWEKVPYPPSARYPTIMYTKAGDLGAYSSIIALLPDFGVGFTVMTAGSHASAASRELSDMLSATFFSALKRTTAEQASLYAGNFTDAITNSTISLILTPSAAGPTLTLQTWTYNNTNLLSAIASLLNIPSPAAIDFTVNLFSSGLNTHNSNGTRIEAWRASYSVGGNDPVVGSAGTGPFSTACQTWTEIDAFTYGGVSFDEFRVEVDEESGRAVGWDARVLQQGFEEIMRGGGGCGNSTVERRTGWMKRV